jgi:excinuclease ABC subunit C
MLNPYINSLKPTIATVPHQAGVYRYYAIDNSLLYIGKAKDLKNRVSQYFQDSNSHTMRIQLMVSQVYRIEYTVVKNESEALILEASLIQSLQPRYNILLKDADNYVYIRFQNKSQIPTITLERNKLDPNSEYLGPYTKKFQIVSSLKTLRQIFPFCSKVRFDNKSCDYYGVKQCDGICIGKENIEDYKSKLDKIKAVLNGDNQDSATWIKNKITEAINQEDYQFAALWRDRLNILIELTKDQKVVISNNQNLDILNLTITTNTEGLNIGSIHLQSINRGKITNVNNYLLSGSEDEEPEKSEENYDKLATRFLERFFSTYQTNNPIYINCNYA